ncbi:hypothetical protein HaLaN_31953, partial [Haematococcus lacustris]
QGGRAHVAVNWFRHISFRVYSRPVCSLVEGREEADAQTAKLAAAQHEVYATRQRRQAASRRLARLDEARAVDSEKLTAHLEALRGARTALKDEVQLAYTDILGWLSGRVMFARCGRKDSNTAGTVLTSSGVKARPRLPGARCAVSNVRLSGGSACHVGQKFSHSSAPGPCSNDHRFYHTRTAAAGALFKYKRGAERPSVRAS